VALPPPIAVACEADVELDLATPMPTPVADCASAGVTIDAARIAAIVTVLMM
jgi:hypothetical protein